jgi:hypothetical protein
VREREQKSEEKSTRVKNKPKMCAEENCGELLWEEEERLLCFLALNSFVGFLELLTRERIRISQHFDLKKQHDEGGRSNEITAEHRTPPLISTSSGITLKASKMK